MSDANQASITPPESPQPVPGAPTAPPAAPVEPGPGIEPGTEPAIEPSPEPAVQPDPEPQFAGELPAAAAA